VVSNVVGRSTPRVDGIEKVTGKAAYTADFPIEGLLWGKALHSPYPLARLVSIDTSAARSLPGVFAVITGAETGTGLYGSNLKDLPVLARDRVRFAGERVAAVAAVDEDTAQQAIDLIDVEYEELPAVFDLDEAMQPDALVIHPDFNSYQGVTATPGPGPFGGLLPLKLPGNAYTSRCDDRGDLDKGFAEADIVLENRYYTQRQHQGYLEPQTSTVEIDSGGRVHVWAGTKMPFGTRGALAGVIGVDPKQVLVHHTYIGGDFGAKATPILLPICYYLAKASGRPVRMVNEYLEELLSGNPRHATSVRFRTGVKKDGTITAHHVQFLVNCGAYGAFKPGGIIFGPEQAAGPYKVPNTRIEAAHVYTNTVPGGYMRGPGESQAVFGLESHIDELAHALGMDPVDFRLKNLAGDGDETAFGVHFERPRGRETLLAAVEASNYRPLSTASAEVTSSPQQEPLVPAVESGRSPAEQEILWRDSTNAGSRSTGFGVALGERPPGGGIGNAAVNFQPDGSVVVSTPIHDQGSGTYTIIVQVVAEELGLPLDRVKIEVWDTDAVPFDSGVAGSWAARVNTGAVHEAIEAAKKELLRFTAQRLEWPEESLALRGDTITSDSLNESIAWTDLLAQANESVGARATHMAGMGELSHVTSYCVQVAEVEVDSDTGEVKLLNLTTAHDVGRIINPIGHQGQINGGVVAGLGYALMEEMRVEEGRVTNLSLGDYKLPTIRDLPRLTTVLVDAGHGVGHYNIKAIGEVPTTPVAPAIANAIFNATGVRLRELPFTSEKVYRALHNTAG
jgi:CO/xanthine dehydrogenase Mo-binding subunit